MKRSKFAIPSLIVIVFGVAAAFGVKAMTTPKAVVPTWYKDASGNCLPNNSIGISCETSNTGTFCVSSAVTYYSAQGCGTGTQVASRYLPN